MLWGFSSPSPDSISMVCSEFLLFNMATTTVSPYHKFRLSSKLVTYRCKHILDLAHGLSTVLKHRPSLMWLTILDVVPPRRRWDLASGRGRTNKDSDRNLIGNRKQENNGVVGRLLRNKTR